MREVRIVVSGLAVVAVVLSLLVSSHAGVGKRCRRLCAADIGACRSECTGGKRARHRCRAQCRKSVLSACRSNPEPQCLPTTTTTIPSCGAGGAPTGFEATVHVMSSGMDRTYARFVPPDYDACRPYPVVFAFHGDGGTGAGLRDALGLEAPAGGAAIFVYPDATEASGRSWELDVPLAQNADMAFVVDILNQLAATYDVDRSRVFATGFSRGAFFVNFLNCRLGTTYLRAIAPQSGSGPYGQPAEYDIDGHFICEAPAAAALLVHGEADAVVPISPDGGYSRDQWAWANGCAATTSPTTPAPCVAYDGCAADKPVLWCAIPGLGHEVWSEASQTIWSFFVSFPSSLPAATTMHVAGRDLYDATGERVVIRGVNKMCVFTDHHGEISFPAIEGGGANSVRIVWATATDDFVPTAQDLDMVIGNALDHHLIAMPELHDATGNLAGVGALVDYWTRPDIVAVIQKYERWLLVNVANEAGDDQVTAEQFLATYTSAVARLRAAGIRTPLVIDAPDWGKNLDVLVATGASLRAADPLHDLLFSVHMYWPLRDGADANFIRQKLDGAVAAGIPLLVGEFSRYGAYAGGASICSDAGEVDYATILAETQRLGIGWYAWEWGPGNAGGGDPLCVVMDMTADGTLPTLKPGWATDVVSGPYGIQATSVIPASIRER